MVTRLVQSACQVGRQWLQVAAVRVPVQLAAGGGISRAVAGQEPGTLCEVREICKGGRGTAIQKKAALNSPRRPRRPKLTHTVQPLHPCAVPHSSH